ncbi:MAG: arylsulfatase A-like enzyme, partial [Myxococcota bacterium]
AGAAQLEDLYPTILSLLGVTTQPPGDGVDLTPWLTDQTQTPPRSTVYGRRKHYEGKTALYYRMQWPEKWIGDVATGGVSYQLDDDAGELAGTREPTAPEDLTHRLRSQAAPTPAPQTLDEESRRALKALGYLE